MANLPDLWNTKRFTSPFREMARIQQDMDRIVEEFIGASGKEMSAFNFSPSCEVSEHDKSYEMKFDLPGIKKEQVKVEVDGSQLTIRAERREEKEEKTKKKHLSEISYGEYMRSFTLPQAIDEKQVQAKFEDGVLLITVPKTEVTKAKQISIH